jgi:hypothetical protein
MTKPVKGPNGYANERFGIYFVMASGKRTPHSFDGRSSVAASYKTLRGALGEVKRLHTHVTTMPANGVPAGFFRSIVVVDRETDVIAHEVVL